MRENSSCAEHLGDISWLCGRTWPPHAAPLPYDAYAPVS